MPWHAMAGRRSSTPTRVRSSPAQLLPACSPARASPSARTAKGPGGIMCSSNGCGAASNTRRYICEPTKPSARRATRSADISTFIIAVAPIRVLTAARRIKPTSPRCRSVRQPNPGRRSTYRRGDSVQTTGTSSPSIQRGKRYSTDDAEGLHLWNRLLETAQMASIVSPAGFAEEQARFGSPTLITPRLGQGAFRVLVTEAYGRQCAITDGKVLPALDAAHIKPYGEGGLHTKSNGILLRKDIHSVFDAGYVTINE